MRRSKKLDSGSTGNLHPQVLPKLEQKVALLKNLGQQPPSSHVLVMATGGTPTYYAVDSLVVEERVVRFYMGDDCVFASRIDAPWAYIKRDRLIELTEGDLAKHFKADSDSQEEFWKTLAPKEFEEAQEQAANPQVMMLPADLMEQLQGARKGKAPVRDDKPAPGQYL